MTVPWEPLPGEQERDPEPVAGAVDRVMRNLGSSTPKQVRSVFDRWPELVGEQVALKATPVSLRDGVLAVAVDDPAWATQLRYLEQQIVAQLQAELGDGEIERIEIKVRRPGAVRPRSGPDRSS